MIYNYQNFSCEVFCGFYESIFCNSNEDWGYYDEAPDGYYVDLLDFDKYQKSICEIYIDNMAKELAFSENPVNVKILNYTGLNQPREYNFRTDRLEFDTEFDLQKLCKYCFGTVKKEFDKYLYEHWSSRSGFCSFVPNNIYQFKQRYDEFIDIMLEFYFLKFINFTDVEIDTYEYRYEAIDEAGIKLVSSEDWSEYECEYCSEKDSLIPLRRIS